MARTVIEVTVKNAAKNVTSSIPQNSSVQQESQSVNGNVVVTLDLSVNSENLNNVSEKMTTSLAEFDTKIANL